MEKEKHRLLGACPKLAQQEYKRRHDYVAKALHWGISRKCGFLQNVNGIHE